MKTKIILISFLFLITIFPQINVTEEMIGNGILYKKIVNTIDTLSIDILKITMSNNEYELRTVKANNLLNSRETTSGMDRTLTDSGYNVIAAINADFFETDGEIVGNMISEGDFVKAVKFTDSRFNPFVNSQFAVTNDKKLMIDQFVFNGQLILPDGTNEQINRINSLPDSNSITLYNSFQGDSTPAAKDNWYVSEISLNAFRKLSDTLFCVVQDSFNNGGKMKINNQLILSANNKFAHYMERELLVGDTFKIILNFNPGITNVQSLVGGWPRLVKDGVNLIRLDDSIEGIIPGFSKNRHPRTGIGFSRDSSTVYFITVDGRQKSSRGMTLEEFADLMIEEGIYQGLNLDGGGSTTMVINNKIVNSPSDKTGERKVGNCIMLIKK
jgi:exopolysaccharide biosynthesis protein